ncbi:MAG: hypothetical protein NC340_02995 [Ruminococcus flavefaciens]|nr:hypothetical protein [Ruminococcus flavefaciens]MCM1229468.1 hypothetical protein [Ruminococcus flavefaciens]
MTFDFVLTTDENRDKIFDYLKPEYRSRNDLNVSNINWTDGVYDSDSGIFLTLIYRVPDGIAHCDMDYYSYIVITDNGGIFTVDNNYNYIKRAYDFRIPEKYADLSDIVKSGIGLYSDYRRRNSYMVNLDDDTHRRLEEINNIMYDRCHRNFPIYCEADALKLFELHDCNQHYIRDTYGKATVENFNRYATDENVLRWRSAKYVEILDKIKSGRYIDVDELGKLYRKAVWYFNMGTNDTCDKLFYKAVKKSFDPKYMPSGIHLSVSDYIDTYIRKYPDRIKNLSPLLDFLDGVNKERFLKGSVERAEKLIYG